jgi:hypothetical protein
MKELILNGLLGDVEGFGDHFCLEVFFVPQLEDLFTLAGHFADERAISFEELCGYHLVVSGGGFDRKVFEGAEEVGFGLLCVDEAEDAIADAGVEIGVEVGNLQRGFSFPETDEDILYDVLTLFDIFEPVVCEDEYFFPIPLIYNGEGFVAPAH